MKDAPAPRPNKRPRLGPSPSETEGTTELSQSKKTKSTESQSTAVKPKKGAGLEDEFMQVMQPRTKKGPSWKDEDPAPVASSSNSPAAGRLKKMERVKQRDDGQDAASQEPEAAAEAMSDLDWLRKHTKPATDVDIHVDKVFEQSDDELVDAPDDDDDVRQFRVSSDTTLTHISRMSPCLRP